MVVEKVELKKPMQRRRLIIHIYVVYLGETFAGWLVRYYDIQSLLSVL